MNFKEIDKIIESIKKLSEEKRVYLERTEKLEEKKQTISETVYRKIKDDYQKKIESLNAEIYPLIEQLAVNKSDLQSKLREVEAELSEINIKKEEIQVRCELGEFTESKAKEMIKTLEDENKEKFELFEKLSAYNEKMEEVLRENMIMDGEVNSEPETGDFEFDGEEQGFKDVSVSDFQEIGDTQTGMDSGISETFAPEPDGTVLDTEEDGTVFVQTPAVDEGKTMLIRQPKIEIISDFMKGTEFRLKLGTTDIGNDESNDIIIQHPSVEFKHAQIVFEPEGFKIYDFNSEKGVFVNNVKIESQVLKEGDIIRLGSIELLFKE